MLCCVSLLSLEMMAQSTDDIALIQSLWGKEKREIVQEYMNLSPVEAPPFWKEYEVYEAARNELGKKRIIIISNYVDNYESLTDAKATELINGAIANNIALQKLAKKTFKNMSKVISPLKAAKFIQLENYFTIAIQMKLQDGLPFIGELQDEMIEK